MKGSREGKGNGNKVARPALFPRLHVSDTKKAGPRGPPRNKMALYEQLTVPSHKYKPSLVPLPSAGRMTMNPSMTTPIYQPQMQASSYDSRYSYMPMGYMSTMIPTMGYMPMMNMGLYGVGAGAGATSSMNGSSARSTIVEASTESQRATSSMNGSSARSTIVEASTESQRVPWGGETFSCPNNSSGQSKLSAPSKKRKENDDFAVPTFSSATQASSQALSTNPFHDRQDFREGWSVQKGKEIATGNRSSACVDQAQRFTKENNMEDDASWISASAECETVSAIDDDAIEDDVSTLELSYRNMDVCPRGSDDSTFEPNISESGQERVKKQKVVADRSGEGFNRQSTTTTRVVAPPELVHDVDSMMAVPEQDIFSSRSSENRSGEVSEQSQPLRESSAETESSIGSIIFRDVVDAFGLQEFWKAQSTITRQQKIFSKQLFELHRVIQVQRILAKTSSLSLNYEEVLEEDEADNVHIMPASPIADVPEVPEIPERFPEANLNQPSNDNSRPVPEALPQPIYPLSVPCQQNFSSGSAWQAMPYAANPWAARMSSPLMYAPYPGPCPPGYAAYPYMGASMPMYGNSGGMQAARFPTWQQPDISQPWGAVESGAAAAWYGEQVVPPAAPMSNMGVVPSAFNSEHLTPVVNQQIQGSNASKGKGHARPCGEGCGVEVIAAKNSGWASGWGSTPEERWGRGKCISGPLGNESDCAEGETGRGDGGCGQYKIREQVAVDEEGPEDLSAQADDSSEPGSKQAELEAETIWPAGAGLLQSRTLKRTRPEGSDSDVSSWFGMSSPAKRILQQNGVIKVVPRAVSATPESAASILLSIQKERQR